MNAARPRRENAIWLLPLAFVIHDAEELATRTAWLARHGETLHQMLQRNLGIEAPEILTPMSLTATGLAMTVELLFFVEVTAALWLSDRRIFLYAYLVALGAFLVHGGVHLAQALLFGGYTPGVVTAAVVVLPGSVFVLRRLMKDRGLSALTLGIALLIGSAIILPGILLALSIGRQFG